MAQAVDIVDGMASSMLENITVGNLLADGLEKLGEIGLEAFKAVAEAIPDLVGHTIELGNQLFEMSMKTGASVENLSALRYVASQSGMDFDSLTSAFFKMEGALGSTGPKADKLSASLEAVGLNMQNLKNSSPDEAFIEIVSALENVGNAADRNALAMQIFGKGAKEMAGLFHDDIYAMLQDAQDLGLVITTQDAAAAHAAEVGWQSFLMQLEAVAMKLADAVVPGLVAVEGLLAGAFQTAVNAGTFSIAGLGDVVKTVIDTLLSWVGTGVLVAKTLYDSFVLLGPMFELVGLAVVDLGVIFLHIIATVTDLASHLPGVGDAFKGVTTVLDMATTGLQTARTHVEGLGDSLKSGQATADSYFNELSSSVLTMQKNLPAAYDAASEKITDFATKSKAAGDVTASSMVDTLTPAMKAFEKAVEDVNSVGTTWQTTLDTIDGSVVENMRDLNAAGVSVKTLETYYGLTAAQGKAFSDMLKDQTTQLKLETSSVEAVTKLWDEYNAVVGSDSGTAYDKAAAAIDKWYGDTVAAHQKTLTDTAEFYQAVTALDDAKYQHLALNTELQDKNSRASFQALADAATANYQFMLAHMDNYVQADIDLAQKDMQAKIDASNNWAQVATGNIDKVTQATVASNSAMQSMATNYATVAGQSTTDATFSQLLTLWGGVWTGTLDSLDSFITNQLELQAVARAQGKATLHAQGVPGFAGGVVDFAGGLAMVGERGPELVSLPAGSTVHPSGSGAGGTVVNITMSGIMASDKASLAALLSRTVVDAVKSVTKLRAV